jgi:hypothetical protein
MAKLRIFRWIMEQQPNLGFSVGLWSRGQFWIKLDYGLALDPDVVSGFFGFGFTRGTYFTWIAQRDGELTSLGLPIMLPQFEGLIWILDLRLDLPIFWNLRLDLPIF